MKPIIRHTNKRHQAAVRKRSDDKRGTARERGYTREWDKFAAGWLDRNPLCLYCANQGRTSAAELVDHIVPHRQIEGRFWPDDGDFNGFFASCCRECHDGPKARAERTADRLGKDVREILHLQGMLPDGFKGVDPEAPILNAGAKLICGAPASGKSTLAKAVWQEHGGVIYDLDDIAEEIGLPRYGRTHEQAVRAIQERDIRLLGHSARKKLILIVSAPTAAERLEWGRRLGCDATLLMVARPTLIKRIKRRSEGNAKAIQKQIEAVDLWFSRADV